MGKLIDTFINKIEEYNDKIAIRYNVSDGYFYYVEDIMRISPYFGGDEESRIIMILNNYIM